MGWSVRTIPSDIAVQIDLPGETMVAASREECGVREVTMTLSGKPDKVLAELEDLYCSLGDAIMRIQSMRRFHE